MECGSKTLVETVYKPGGSIERDIDAYTEDIKTALTRQPSESVLFIHGLQIGWPELLGGKPARLIGC
jgi:hypothetical protein